MNKTIFILLDACQYEAGTRNLGYLEQLVDYGKCAKYKVRGELPSQSRPIYATLLTGMPAWEHGIVNNDIRETLEAPSLFSLCKENSGVTAAAAFCWVSELFNRSPFQPRRDHIQLKSDGQIDHGVFYWQDEYPDSHVLADGAFLTETYDPDFLMLHTMFIDYMGHIHGAGTKYYEDAIVDVGNLLSSYIPGWMKTGYNVVITADHGMDNLGIHGGTPDVHRDVPLYILSSQVCNGRFEEEYISQLDVAPLMCRLLGVPVPETMKQTIDIRFLP